LEIFNSITFEDKLFSFGFKADLLVIQVQKNKQSKNVPSTIFPDILDILECLRPTNVYRLLENALNA
jgi:hypothetical protein